jgi:signal recognition particle receptor subunit alpha
LLDIDALKKSKTPRPYTIVFVGVNGVGKSTSLAKVCYWLQQNGLKVMIAAWYVCSHSSMLR